MNTKIYNMISASALSILMLILIGTLHIKAGPGDLDPTFSGDGKLTDGLFRGSDSVGGLAVQSDGKIVVAGTSWTGLNYDFSVARYDIDGSLDNTFGEGGKVTTDFDSSDDRANSIAIQPDGKIVAAGTASNFDFGVVRYNADGSLDTSFNGDGRVTTEIALLSYDEAFSVAIHLDGKIVVVGRSWIVTGSVFSLTRYYPDGSLDASFGSDGIVTTDFPNGTEAAYSVALHADGRIVVAGESYDFLGNSAFTLLRYRTDGSLDLSFDGDGRVTVSFGLEVRSRANSVGIQTDGKIAAVGVCLCSATTSNIVGYRYNTDGSVDGSWGTNPTIPGFFGYGEGHSVAVQPNGKIVTVGTIEVVGGNYSLAIFRLNADLSNDSTLGNNGVLITPIDSYSPHPVATQPDGKIVVAGNGRSPSNLDYSVYRFNANGSFDTSFDGDGKVTTDFGFFQGNTLNDAAVQSDGKIVGAGGVLDDFALVRYTWDGLPDTTFGAGTGKVRTDMGSSGDTARALAIQTDGKIVAAGGSYDWDDNQCCFALARYNTDGSLDTTFSDDGKVITGGHDGTGLGDGAFDIAIQPDGKIIAAGNRWDNQSGFVIVRYNTDGSLDPSFDGDGIVTTRIGLNAGATSVALQLDGKIVASGLSSNGFTVTRYNANGSLDSSFGTGGIVTTLTSIQDQVYSSVLQPDGKIIVAGSRLIISNDYDPTGFALIRYDPNGSLDTTFGEGGIVTTQVGLHSEARDVALLPDGKIVAAGRSNAIGNSADFAVVRYNSNGSLDTTFGGDGITTADFESSNDLAHGMALDYEGRAVVGGESEGRFAIARFLLAPRPTRFDFDGDGRSDVSVFRPSDRIWYLNRSTDGFTAAQFGLSTDQITPADYDGDGKTDISIFRDGVWWRINSSNNTATAVQFGQAGDIPVPADYTGDGRDELAVYRGGQWWAFDLTTGQASFVNFGSPGDKAVPADYDGDGHVDQAVYRNGEWHLNRSRLGHTAVSFGLPSDRPVAGDYDGDGKADIAVYRDGTWYLLESTAGFTAIQWGIATDVPAPADYDGDGKTDVAVYRDGVWYLLQSTAGFSAIHFGLSGDKPIPSAFVP